MNQKIRIYLRSLLLVASVLIPATTNAQSVLYIYGDVAPDGTAPSGPAPSFEPMRLNDTGDRGVSQFRDMVQAEGYSITERYADSINLDTNFLNQYDVIVFSLHQKIWSTGEKNALRTWLQGGGGMLIYSDSAAGGSFGQVGTDNPTGQNVVKNLVSEYGIQVTVDQAHGDVIAQAVGGNQHPIVQGGIRIMGEGVSPVVVNTADPLVQILIPYNGAAIQSGNSNVPRQQGITIPAGNRAFAVAALRPVGSGNIIATFDRQPMWNVGNPNKQPFPVNINTEDNKEMLRRIIRFLAGDLGGGNGNTNFVSLRRRSSNNNFAMDGGVGGTNGQNVKMWGYNPTNVNQQWQEISRGNNYFTYKKRDTIYVLDGGGGAAQNDDNVKLWNENPTNQNQHWRKANMGNGYYRLEKRNADTHSIDGGGGPGFNDQNVKLWNNNNGNFNQHWLIQ